MSYTRIYGQLEDGYYKSWSGEQDFAYYLRLCKEIDAAPVAYESWDDGFIEQAAYAQRVAVLIREGKGLSGGAIDVKVVINEHKPRKPVPACPPEVWAAPAAGVDYMAAVRAMCKGDAK